MDNFNIQLDVRSCILYFIYKWIPDENLKWMLIGRLLSSGTISAVLNELEVIGTSNDAYIANTFFRKSSKSEVDLRVLEEVVLDLLIYILGGDTSFDKEEKDDISTLTCRNRIQLLSTLLTLCGAYKRASGNNELGLLLSNSYKAYTGVYPTYPIDFTKVERRIIGSYVDTNCLKIDQDDFDDSIPTEEKFPQFWKNAAVDEVALELIFNKLISNEEIGKGLFGTDYENSKYKTQFMSLFEGIPSMKDASPTKIKIGHRDYWTILLSALYPGKKRTWKSIKHGIVARSRKASTEFCISKIACEILVDSKGKVFTQQTAFDQIANKIDDSIINKINAIVSPYTK